MSLPVLVVGIGADGISSLSPAALAAVQGATFLAGGRRHLALVGPTASETFALSNNLPALLDRLAARGDSERCVVLASGDPLFYGVGHALIERLGREAVQVVPSLSSMALAFARARLSWHDAKVASLHGRPLKPTLLPLLGLPKLGLFTGDGSGPAAVAAFLLDRGLNDYEAWVCERLGTAQEAVTHAPIASLVGRRFDDLNIVILRRDVPRPGPKSRPLDDSAFDQPASGPVLLTHEDVRALVVRRFAGLTEGPVWDVGAGLGGVSIELARAFPGSEVVAVERSATQAPYLAANRLRFGAYNVRILEGEAPEALAGEEAEPAGLFLGGSGGRLGPILDLAARRLKGRLVANFVGLENLTECLAWVRGLGWPHDLAQILVQHARPLAGLTTFVPQRPVWVLRADRPPHDAP